MLTLEQFVKRRREERAKEEARLCGCGCGHSLALDDKFDTLTFGGRLVRSDCYYAAMGDLVEKHPIRHPRIGRGQAGPY